MQPEGSGGRSTQLQARRGRLRSVGVVPHVGRNEVTAAPGRGRGPAHGAPGPLTWGRAPPTHHLLRLCGAGDARRAVPPAAAGAGALAQRGPWCARGRAARRTRRALRAHCCAAAVGLGMGRPAAARRPQLLPASLLACGGSVTAGAKSLAQLQIGPPFWQRLEQSAAPPALKRSHRCAAGDLAQTTTRCCASCARATTSTTRRSRCGATRSRGGASLTSTRSWTTSTSTRGSSSWRHT